MLSEKVVKILFFNGYRRPSRKVKNGFCLMIMMFGPPRRIDTHSKRLQTIL